jgi:HK97 family phage prohead protease
MSFFVKGYAAVYNIEDSVKDILIKTSFINLHKTIGVACYINHILYNKIGHVYKIENNDYGLKVIIQIDKHISKNFLTEIIRNKLFYLSVGFYIKKFHHDRNTGIKYITEAILKEISVVSHPAQRLSVIHSIYIL